MKKGKRQAWTGGRRETEDSPLLHQTFVRKNDRQRNLWEFTVIRVFRKFGTRWVQYRSSCSSLGMMQYSQVGECPESEFLAGMKPSLFGPIDLNVEWPVLPPVHGRSVLLCDNDLPGLEAIRLLTDHRAGAAPICFVVKID